MFAFDVVFWVLEGWRLLLRSSRGYGMGGLAERKANGVSRQAESFHGRFGPSCVCLAAAKMVVSHVMR